jgi:hypothetical protein
MPKKSRIRQTKQKKSTLQRQKQSQEVKQSVRVVVNLKERRARRRPARKMPTLAPFRGEPLRPSSARLWNDNPPPIMSGNISDDQRKAIMAEGAKQLALEYRTAQRASDLEAAIENDRDVPRLAFGGRGGGSEAGSVASTTTRSMPPSISSLAGSRTMGFIPSFPPSLFTATQSAAGGGAASAEQDLSGTEAETEKKKRGRPKQEAIVRIQEEFNKVIRGGGRSKSSLKAGASGFTEDMVDELDKMITQYLVRNPTFSLNKSVQPRFRNVVTGKVQLSDVEEEDES